MYLVKSPRWLKSLYHNLVWHGPSSEAVYLTFDDGPTPEITEWVLQQLEQYQFKASFFLIGKNIQSYPGIFQKLVQSGHSLGNHSFDHLNGWRTSTADYLENFRKCDKLLGTRLFRPPYGRISRAQAREISTTHKIIMWDVISGDFDTSIDGKKCYQNVVRNIRPGSIIVFHDSAKAWPRLKVALPELLLFLKQNGLHSAAL